MKKNTLSMLIAAAFAASSSTIAVADEDNNPLSGYSDEAFVSMTGTITEVRDDEFDILSGSGSVTVEIDDADRDAEAYGLMSGDKVTVSGEIDDDWFEGREIEASAIHVWKLETTFITDGDYDHAYGMSGDWFAEGMSTLTGTVTSINDDDEFTISTGNRIITVDVDELSNNPLDDEGYLKVMAGDRVRVIGEIDDDWFDGPEIEAEYVNVIK